MMNGEMMHGGGWMMAGMMVLMLLVVAFLIAGIVYFVKGAQSHSRSSAGTSSTKGDAQ